LTVCPIWVKVFCLPDLNASNSREIKRHMASAFSASSETFTSRAPMAHTLKRFAIHHVMAVCFRNGLVILIPRCTRRGISMSCTNSHQSNASNNKTRARRCLFANFRQASQEPNVYQKPH
jgi:hypothetical protein